MRILSVMLVFLMLVGCSKSPKAPAYPGRLPVTEQVKELSELPPYQAKLEGGDVVPLEKDETAPFAGVLLTEDKAMASAELRVSYDDVYQRYLADRKAMLVVITVQEQELYRGDKIIDKKDHEIDQLRNSWWQRNKMNVGVVIGLAGGIALTLLAGWIWSEMEEGAVEANE